MPDSGDEFCSTCSIVSWARQLQSGAAPGPDYPGPLRDARTAGRQGLRAMMEARPQDQNWKTHEEAASNMPAGECGSEEGGRR